MVEEEIVHINKPELQRPPVRTAADLQRLRLERLLEHPERPIIIPERPPERSFPEPPEFVRNVMGSSAGAGSGEFHVYRHIRRREYARQRFIAAQARREELDADFQKRLQENQERYEQRTAKRRLKRLKTKERKRKKQRTEKTAPVCPASPQDEPHTESDYSPEHVNEEDISLEELQENAQSESDPNVE